MPYFGSDAVEAHSVPKRKFSGPIFPIAGRPDSGNDSHAAHGEDAAEEEDGVHHSFQPLGRGTGQLESFHKNT